VPLWLKIIYEKNKDFKWLLKETWLAKLLLYIAKQVQKNKCKVNEKFKLNQVKNEMLR